MEEADQVSSLDGENVISLETYRKNGDPVRTPVWFLQDDGVIYVHTGGRTGKVKRIRQNTKVKIAPSTFRGKPKADYVDATAVLETSADTVGKYYSLIYKKYGVVGSLTKFIQRFSRSKTKDVIIMIRTQSQGQE